MRRVTRLAHNMLCRQLVNSDQFLPMKFFMLLGGFVGFLLTMMAGIFAGAELWVVVLNASFGCIGGALLFRMFRKVVASSVREAVAQKARQSSPEIAS